MQYYGSRAYRHMADVVSSASVGEILLTTCRDNFVYAWLNGELKKRISPEIPAPTKIVPVGSVGSFVVLGNSAGLSHFKSIDSAPTYLKFHSDRVSDVCPLPNSDEFLSCGSDGQVVCWNEAGDASLIYSSEKSFRQFSLNDEGTLAYLSQDERLFSVELATGETKNLCCFEPNAWFAWYDDQSIVVNGESGTYLQDFQGKRTVEISSLPYDCCIVFNGAFFGLRNRKLFQFKELTAVQQLTSPLVSGIPASSIELAGDQLILCSPSTQPAFVSLETLQQVAIDDGHSDAIDSLLFTDTRELVSIGRDNQIKRWSIDNSECAYTAFVENWNLIANASKHPSKLNQIFFTVGNKADRALILWDTSKNEQVEQISLQLDATITSFDMDAACRFALLGCYRNGESFFVPYDMEKRFLLNRLCDEGVLLNEDYEESEIDTSEIEKAAIHTPSALVYGISSDDVFCRWSGTGEFETTLASNLDLDVNSIESGVHFFWTTAHNGEMMVAIQSSREIVIVSLVAETIVTRLESTKKLHVFGFNCGQSRIAFGFTDSTITILDLANAKFRKSMTCDSQPTCLAIDDKGKCLAVGMRNGLISIVHLG